MFSLDSLDFLTLLKSEKSRRKKLLKFRKSAFLYMKETFKSYRKESWHHKVFFNIIQQAIERKQKRVMLFAPPRHMKTETQIRAIAWALGRNPNDKIMVTAYGQTKARKISRSIKQIIKDRCHSNIFPAFNDYFDNQASDTQDYWEIGGGQRGSLLASGVGGSITGEGFNIALVDDPCKSREDAESTVKQEKDWDWWNGTFLNRQDEEDAIIIITTTRWKDRDLAGKILEQDGIKKYNGHDPSDACPDWNGKADGEWYVYSFPAIMEDYFLQWRHEKDTRNVGEALWASRFSVDFFQQFKKSIYNWYALFMNTPRPRVGSFIQPGWFHEQDYPSFEHANILRFWDLAATEKKFDNDPDFSAGALVAEFQEQFFIVDVKAFRGTPKEVEDKVLKTAKEDKQRYHHVTQCWEQEPGASGVMVSQYFRKLLSFTKNKIHKTTKSKEFYVEQLALQAEYGNVFYTNDYWVRERCDGMSFFEEVASFPMGTHDDRLDAVAKAVYMLAQGNDSGQLSAIESHITRAFDNELF